MQGTLISHRVLYPPPQAVPLLPHGRRLRQCKQSNNTVNDVEGGIKNERKINEVVRPWTCCIFLGILHKNIEKSDITLQTREVIVRTQKAIGLKTDGFFCASNLLNPTHAYCILHIPLTSPILSLHTRTLY